ncbi:unnamed protein product [Fructobacillus tropaeoli]|uniref:hypothetical protein n=1 Tax=Fructobacillus tropaeoli TaxID=709323 RepID=UPI002D9C9698|nr:unnamed protein product [Fructobacillus tropaeoli]
MVTTGNWVADGLGQYLRDYDEWENNMAKTYTVYPDYNMTADEIESSNGARLIKRITLPGEQPELVLDEDLGDYLDLDFGRVKVETIELED